MAKRITFINSDEGTRSLREFHRLGRQSLEKHGDELPRGGAVAAADEYGFSNETLRKARCFAKSYSRQELEALCRLCNQHGHRRFGSAYVASLMLLPKAQREKLQLQAVKNRWSLGMLHLQLRKRVGKRRHGGQRFRMPADQGEAYYMIQKLCGSWRRLCVALGADADDDDETVRGVWPELLATIRTSISAARKLLGELEGRVTKLWTQQSGQDQGLPTKRPNGSKK